MSTLSASASRALAAFVGGLLIAGASAALAQSLTPSEAKAIADDRATIRRSLAAYRHQVLQYEWQSLGDGKRDEQADDFFARFLNTIVEVTPRSEAEQAVHSRLLDLAQTTREYHDERVSKSLTRIPPTLAGLVNTIAGVLLLLIFVYPFHHWLAGVSSLIIIAVVLFLANFVMMDTDNPLKGVWNVSSQPFSDLRF